ncbi:MAG: LysR family transcriptional regulator [Holophaga sp.]|jgi:DNA-binding transcriptional LysR family regulator
MIRTHIPSTQALRVFESAARYLNCAHAAQELCLTTSAVSKQLQSLESCLGVELFTRGKFGLTLTEAGRIYLACTREALAKLTEGGVKVARQKRQSEVLQLQVLPTFAERLLLSLYNDLSDSTLNGKVQFSIYPMVQLDETFPYMYDGYICFGEGNWPGCISDYLCGKELILVGGRTLLEDKPIQSAADLANFTLIEHSEVPTAWPQAFEALKIKPECIDHIIKWDFYSVLIRGVCVGLGLALIPRCFIEEQLKSGEMVQVLNYSQINPLGYYLVFPEENKNNKLLNKFRIWIKSKMINEYTLQPLQQVETT